ncbi:hypothetical protein [Methylobacterium haplocladii]|nr:hypothetical protein [Methylobacterium haplocladii]
MTGKKLARRNAVWGAGGGGRRGVRPHVRKAAARSFLMAVLLIPSAVLLLYWIGTLI